jgi:2-octaprenyl-6-methoxyphenol hydroxylase
VWTEAKEAVPHLLALGPEDQLLEVERRFGLELGRITLETALKSYPLGFGMARAFRAERLALLGDAAHVIHPIAGQGLNLGLYDAAALAEAVADAVRLGLDPGRPETLAQYERARRFDTLTMGMVTDGLNRLFSNDLTPIRLVRDLGLGLVDRMPPLKNFFIRRAAGLASGQPRLMRGEAL